MVRDYKLCPKCNNALDNNVMQCPYCGNNTFFGNVGKNNRIESGESTVKQKKSSGCVGCLSCLFFLVIILFMIFVKISFQKVSDPHNSPFFQVRNLDN